MGRAFAGNRLFIDIFFALAAMATKTFGAAGSDDPRYNAGFASRFVFAQASFVQTDAHVGRGEVNQRRRQLVESDGARLPLLVAAIADGVRLVDGQKSRMVQAFFRRVLPRN